VGEGDDMPERRGVSTAFSRVMMLKTVAFINTHPNWRDLLTNSPFNLIIKEDENYLLFEYNQQNADFTIDLVRECRGLILTKNDFTPVCVPFFKFGNYGEAYVDSIDWKTAVAQDKLDGSIIKLWFHQGWHVSTKDQESTPTSK
jgi:hypothetical protein